MADKYILNEVKAKGDIVSCKAHREIQRGEFFELVKLEGNTAYEIKDATKNTDRGNLVVSIAEVKMYDERLTEKDFSTKEGEVFRARNPHVHCVHTMHADLVDKGVVEGDLLALGAGKLVKATEGSVAIAKVEMVKVWCGQESVQVRYL